MLSKRNTTLVLLKLYFLALSGLLSCQIVTGQAMNSVFNALAFPSPNNTFLNAIGTTAAHSNVSVDLYSGAAQISVPICDLGSRKLSIPITLNYISGKGIKVQDYAGYTGLGWQLSAGGSISRVVRGFPDEHPNGYIGTANPQWGKVIANWLQNGATFTPAQQAAIGGTISGHVYNPPTADSEPDLYYVKTPYFNFQFSFDETGNPIFSDSTGFKIVHTLNNNSNFTTANFEVIDDRGNQYYFGSTQYSIETVSTTLLGQTVIFPTTWFLDKIVAFNSSDVINFSYISGPNDTLYHYQSLEYYQVQTGTCAGQPFNIVQGDQTPLQSVYISPLYISQITSLSGELDFNYLFDRQDDIRAARLVGISLKAFNPISGLNTTNIKSFGFNYSYFGAPNADPNFLRLKLNNITITGSTPATSIPQTLQSFNYLTTYLSAGDSLPSRKSSSFDYWGYYNNYSGLDPVIYPQSARLPGSGVFANLLTSIIDIEGGKTNLYYEPNTYRNGSINTTVGGVRVNQISHTLPTGENINTTYNYNDSQGNSTGSILTPNYTQLFWYNGTPAACTTWDVTAYSESPFNIYDLNGNFVGYSAVQVNNQNGGYTKYSFTSFNDFPDIINQTFGNQGPAGNQSPFYNSSISFSYKRGLLKSEILFNSAGQKIKEITNTYNSLTSLVKRSYGYHALEFEWAESGYYTFGNGSGSYYVNVENYKPIQTITKDYAQGTAGTYLQNQQNVGYNLNNRLIEKISTTDSKSHLMSETQFHPNDPAIPMITGSEQTAVNLLMAYNENSANVHVIDSLNNAFEQVHNSFTIIPVASTNPVYLTTRSSYVGGTLKNQTNFNYDISNSNLLSSSTILGSKFSSTQYGYNSCYPVAQVENASSTSSYSLQTITSNGYFNLPGSAAFTTTSVGTITILLSFGSYPGATNLTQGYYTLSGPSSQSGTLCYTTSGSGYSCTYGTSVSFPNMPIGTYSLSGSMSTNVPSSNPNFSYSYSSQVPVYSYSKEFFYDGFEENTSATAGSAHTGNMFYNANYTTSYSPPNGRSYVIQWWNLVGGAWLFNESAYTNGMTLTGPVDDIRIFPSDAQMTSFTYNPLIGKTSSIDPSGKSTKIAYDGLGRLSTVRDLDGNILKKYDYQYGYSNNTALTATNATSVSYTLTYNNTTSGTSYSFTLPASGTFNVGNIPSGTYNVFMTPSSYSPSTPITYTLGGSSQTYYATVEFGSVSLAGTSNVNIIYPPVQSVTIQNSCGSTCTVTFTNLSTSAVTNFSQISNGIVTTKGTLPAGNYSVKIVPAVQKPSLPNIYTVYSSSQFYYGTVTFNNVSVNSTCPVVIQSNLP